MLDALQQAERRKEKGKIELEVQKNNVDPETRKVSDLIIVKLEHWFVKSRMDEGSDA